ncbi:AMP-binding protein [Rhodococcus fascians]|nr:AMP-binding protein [Rhodococcus fascians]MBY4237888.1 AMP-binding protein [Rhodococcus fascians]MBY4253361.1 AMP-binding protein [Rhodococcus fascians]MBY4268998.1 AMP-binding protein [Rhodococcus fascians]MBY4275051.1 AMP-binding protein [Rhodococcus fascians]
MTGRAAPSTIPEHFAEAVARVPERVALQYFDGVLTYRNLDALVVGLASHFIGSGLVAGDRIAVKLQSSPHFVVTVLAAWRIGCVVVPINPMYRRAEVEGLLVDCSTRAVVCSHEAYVDAVKGIAVDHPGLVVLTTDERDFQTRNDGRAFGPVHDFSPDELSGAEDLIEVASSGARVPARLPSFATIALICYTSGTSGPPKGAILTHGNLAVDIESTAGWLGLGDGARIFAMAPLFHVTGLVVEFAQSIALAGTLILPYRFAPAVAIELFAQHRPKFTVGPPTAYMALMAIGDTADAFASFEVILSGGAPLPPAVVDEFERRFGLYIVNGYGLTETSAACVLMPIGTRAPVDDSTTALANGLPMPGVELRIVDADGIDVPDGQKGEIVVRGAVVSPGYWKRPVETAAAFRDGWFRTGDVGVFGEGRLLYVVDRMKDMIIASGFKVWPGEVEQVLYSHSAVREAAVVGVADEYRGESVKAFVVVDPAAGVRSDDLVVWCRKNLAAFKVPREIEVIGELPKTASGKILRRALK